MLRVTHVTVFNVRTLPLALDVVANVGESLNDATAQCAAEDAHVGAVVPVSDTVRYILICYKLMLYSVSSINMKNKNK